MIKKQISKISILASLLVATMVNAQEFYTCVPKKSWWGDVIRENVEKGVRKGQRQEWNHITTIDFTKIINDGNLNQDNLSIFNGFLSPGTYRFKLNLKHKNGTILNVFENKLDLNKNGYLFLNSLTYNCMNDNYTLIRDFYKKYTLYANLFVQNRELINLPTCKPDYNVGISTLSVDNYVLYVYEHLSKWSNNKLYNENFVVNEQVNDDNHRWLSENPYNIFRYSTLEIYKKNDD